MVPIYPFWCKPHHLCKLGSRYQLFGYVNRVPPPELQFFGWHGLAIIVEAVASYSNNVACPVSPLGWESIEFLQETAIVLV